MQKKLDTLSQMMDEYRAMPFPNGFRGLDIEDQDMVMLDSATTRPLIRSAGKCASNHTTHPQPRSNRYPADHDATKASTTLCPPNPKAWLTAVRTSCSRARFVTQSMSNSGAGA